MRRKATKGKIITQKEFEILRNIFADQDTDESGVVDFQEFLRAFEVYPGGHNGPASILRRDTAACVFSQMDANNDGVMTFRELLMAYYPRCDAEYVDRIMSMYEPKTDAERKLETVLTSEQEEELEYVMGKFDMNQVACKPG
eukprot:TRINITY_DN386_c0_g2_i11.p1 TRINITY_DN386_c0_g2~~TRINITY_DN386_c0_g2_i11.p1  ORF type:complete len:142 (+),score=29.92 TRINITY_DN386_c0_g2_i11:129-554(+)